MTARAYWVEAAGRGAIRDAVVGEPGDGEVRVRTLFTGISRGTESLVFQGKVPLNQAEAMRCPNQEGDFSFPIKYGYIAVGVVESGCDLEGQAVFCLHPHQTHFVVPRAAVTVLPAGLDPSLAVLCANMETAINGVWDADPSREDTVTVIGAGVVGALVAWRIQQQVDTPVQLVDTQPRRAELAAALGVAFATPAAASPERSLIVHCSGSERGLQQALTLAAADGKIVEMSWFGDRQVSLALGEHFHSRRLTLQSSQVGSIPPRMRAEWSYERRMQLVLELLTDHPELSVLIDAESMFADLPNTMSVLAQSAGGVLCHRVRYKEDTRCID